MGDRVAEIVAEFYEDREQTDERVAIENLARALARVEGEHPEHRCDRCDRLNVWSWHAPSPLWNAVMRDPATGKDAFGIVCPPCFAELAEAAGVVPAGRHTWHFAPHDLDIGSLWADRDGRVWDPDRCLWVAMPEPYEPIAMTLREVAERP